MFISTLLYSQPPFKNTKDVLQDRINEDIYYRLNGINKELKKPRARPYYLSEILSTPLNNLQADNGQSAVDELEREYVKRIGTNRKDTRTFDGKTNATWWLTNKAKLFFTDDTTNNATYALQGSNADIYFSSDTRYMLYMSSKNVLSLNSVNGRGSLSSCNLLLNDIHGSYGILRSDDPIFYPAYFDIQGKLNLTKYCVYSITDGVPNTVDVYSTIEPLGSMSNTSGMLLKADYSNLGNGYLQLSGTYTVVSNQYGNISFSTASCVISTDTKITGNMYNPGYRVKTSSVQWDDNEIQTTSAKHYLELCWEDKLFESNYNDTLIVCPNGTFLTKQ